MIPDKLLINLKILSKIQKNGRISRSYDGIISLESCNIYQPLKRFFSKDSRKQAVFEINSIITESITNLNNIFNSKYINKIYYNSEEFYKHCEAIELLLEELSFACEGIENLKFTYQSDPNISSQIDIIIIKTKSNIKEFTLKLENTKSLNSFNVAKTHFDEYISNSITVPKTSPTSIDINIGSLNEQQIDKQSLINCVSI